MDIKDQKIMAFEGIQSWAHATINQVARIETSLPSCMPEATRDLLPVGNSGQIAIYF
jgi:hypothetical protein